MPDSKLPELWSLYALMLKSRLFEEGVTRLWQEGCISGEMHLGTGEEAILAGIVPQLREGDAMALDHRGSAAMYLRGVDPASILGELLGQPDGLCGGMGGHMHLFSKEHLAASSGIVGAEGPAADGFALAATFLRPGCIAVAFFGEAAMNQGMLMESMNLASAWRLPVLFVCKDDRWGITTPASDSTGGDLLERARGLGLTAVDVDGSDVSAVWLSAQEAIGRLRSGQGPVFLHATCVHLEGHFLGFQLIRMQRDPLREMPPIVGPLTRSFLHPRGASLRERIAGLKTVLGAVPAMRGDPRRDPARDPIQRARATLLSDPPRLQALEDQVKREIETLLASTKRGSSPASTPNPERWFGPPLPHPKTTDRGGRGGDAVKQMNFTQAIDHALAQAMAQDERIVLFGEDVPLMRSNLLVRFGPQRVRGTPISESAFLGAGVAAAMAGLRPVVEIYMVDFLGVCMDALLNQAVKVEAFSGGKWTVPLVVRAPCGGGYGDGGQHEQSLWGWLAHLPGLVVLVPSTPADAGGLLLAALQHDGPVIFLEHKLLSETWLEFLGAGGRRTVQYDVPAQGRRGPVPAKWAPLPIGKAVLRRSGGDVTLVSVGVGVHRALEAAQALGKEGISAGVLDLRTVMPLDRDMLCQEVSKTGRLVVVDEDYENFGLSGEIAALLLEAGVAFRYARVCTQSTIPYARHLEVQVLPNVERIYAAVRGIL
jgi:pyruvate/2-oxoglutarate/acetoin dehydrogenase E1 component/TPP-dependent pyruvate/acetoin dehydrogenase alpha subunit